ncbi:hypothetical protein F4802DRAFT_572889 [Xylaria palmicola]|nr:hypothetical protein F4802DRAFT_572889 [Xylaria palmicola]
MAGRTRRTTSASASASTAATANQESVRHYRETSILKPVSPSTHSDNWPCFLLSDATVYAHNGALVSQLDVDALGPFIIRGRLELEKDNARYLVNRHMKHGPLWIQIEGSRAFSIGAKDDSLSNPVVWASGQAGWFEIVPAESYRRHCDEMYQGVTLHYSMLDQYEAALEKLRKSKKKKNATLADVSLDLDELLFQYALCSGDGLTLPEAHKRLGWNCIFLLSHFPRETNVYKHLAARSASLVQMIAENKGETDKRTKNPRRDLLFSKPCPLKAYDYSEREKSSSVEVVDGRKKGKGRPNSRAPRSTRASETTDVDAVNISSKNRQPHPSKSTKVTRKPPANVSAENEDIIMVDQPSSNSTSSVSVRNNQTELHKNNSAMNSNTTEEENSSAHVLVDALEDVRRQMLQLISEGRQKKQLDQITAKSWQTKVYMECNIKAYNSMEEIFHYYAQGLVQRLGPHWHETQIYQWVKEKASKPATLTLISETEVKQIVRRIKKSARAARTDNVANETQQPKQPEAREYAGKQTPRGRPSGKAAGLRPSTGSKKRLRHEVDFEDNMDLDEDGLPTKRSKRSHYLTEEADDEDEDDEDDNGENVEGDDENSAGDSGPLTEEENILMTPVVIQAERLSSTQPHGPNQTWVCEEPDCGFTVRAAHEEQGQRQIHAHYEEHEKEARDVAQEMALNRVNLAVQEARGHMPINHLLEKIRNLGEKSKRRDEVILNGQVVPEPIRKSLLI